MKPQKFQTIIWISDEKEHQLIIRTKTQREVFYSPSSVELVVHTFVSSIVNECNLHADSDAVQILKISAAIMCPEEEKGIKVCYVTYFNKICLERFNLYKHFIPLNNQRTQIQIYSHNKF